MEIFKIILTILGLAAAILIATYGEMVSQAQERRRRVSRDG